MVRDYLYEDRLLGDVEGSDLRISVWDTARRDRRGQSYLGYSLMHGREEVFAGEDFAGSPRHADDSDETLAGLLGFLSLRPGDTDAEYFDSYTPSQLAWADRCGEQVAGIANELLESTRPGRCSDHSD